MNAVAFIENFLFVKLLNFDQHSLHRSYLIEWLLFRNKKLVPIAKDFSSLLCVWGGGRLGLRGKTSPWSLCRKISVNSAVVTVICSASLGILRLLAAWSDWKMRMQKSHSLLYSKKFLSLSQCSPKEASENYSFLSWCSAILHSRVCVTRLGCWRASRLRGGLLLVLVVGVRWPLWPAASPATATAAAVAGCRHARRASAGGARSAGHRCCWSRASPRVLRRDALEKRRTRNDLRVRATLSFSRLVFSLAHSQSSSQNALA